MEYRIYKEGDYLGTMTEDGTKMTPPVYDENETNDNILPYIGRLVSVITITPNEFIEILKKTANIVPIQQIALDLFTSKYSYFLKSFETTIKQPASEQDWQNLINILYNEGLWGSTNISTINVFVTNEKTAIKIYDLYKYKFLTRTALGLGTDNSIADGEVRWIQCNCYNESYYPCDFETSYIIGNKEFNRIKSGINKEYWAEIEEESEYYIHCYPFLHCDMREWDEAEKVLEHMYKFGHNVQYLINNIIERLKGTCVSSDEPGYDNLLEYYKKSIAWALSKQKFINDPNSENYYERLLEEIDDCKEENSRFTRDLEEIRDMVRNAGALTDEEVSEKQKAFYESLEPYDYTYINNWKTF